MGALFSMLIAGITVANYGYAAETWISVKGHPVSLHSQSVCDNIADDDGTICDCCLVNTVARSPLHEVDAIHQCSVRYACSFDKDAYDNRKTARLEIDRAKKHLKAMTIVDLSDLSQKIALPENGVLEPHDILSILISLSRDGHVSLPEVFFAKENALRIKAIGDGAKGYFSGQLFAIQYDPTFIAQSSSTPGNYQPLYILKETKKGVKEIFHLYKVATSPLGNEKISTTNMLFSLGKNSSDSGIAKIAFDDLHFKFIQNGTTRYFSLLQTARGQSLHHHLKEFGKLASTREMDSAEFISALTNMKHTFYRIGYAMSLLHQKYASPESKKKFARKKTFLHGDLHSENLFYDSETDTVTLIDNETFALSLKRPSSGINDIVEFYMLHTIHTVAHKVSTQLTTNVEFGINDQLWQELWRSLFKGYFAAFGPLPLEDFEKLFDGVKREFFNGFSQRKNIKSIRHLKDQRKLKRFGPSFRRYKIKHHSLAAMFERLRQEELTRFTDVP